MGSSSNERQSGGLKIQRIRDKRQVAELAPIFREYTRVLGKEDNNDELMISIFTRVDRPDKLLLIAIKDNEVMGFLWAQGVSKFQEDYLRISEIYSRGDTAGSGLFREALWWAAEGGYRSVKGLVGAGKAQAMARLFKTDIEAVLISVEV